MDSVEVYRSVLLEPISNKKLNVVSHLRVQLRTWKCAVCEDSNLGSIADWIDKGVGNLDKELDGASMCRRE